jgi:hypothetical protein
MCSKRLRGLCTQENRAATALFRSFERAKNRETISWADRALIHPKTASDLNAANPFARALWGNALWSEFNAQFGLSDDQPIPKVPLFWVTVCDVACMTALDDRNVNLAPIIRHLRSVLKGKSYLGMVDVALYANVAPGTNFSERTGLSWHLHLFVWGATRKEMRSLSRKLNSSEDNCRPIIPRPEGRGFHWDQVTEDNFERRFRYVVKTPRKACRIRCIEGNNADGKAEFRFQHLKSSLRYGQRVTLFHVLKDHTLDEFTVAGGEGVDIRRRALRRVG